MTWRKISAWVVALALCGVPLVTTATCDPRAGVFDFFRDDDGYGFYDVIYYDEYYYDPYYYDDYYYDDCWLCF